MSPETYRVKVAQENYAAQLLKICGSGGMGGKGSRDHAAHALAL